ncbi:MAG TPA: O-methyltransferase [Phycisphaerae bacterium]|nr:O-methyltransferase [Phycisphaerae bacterium]
MQDPQSQWTAIDNYFAAHLIPPDAALDAALQSATAANLPNIHVAPNQGKLLHLLAQSINATRILEIGTLAAYSTIWLARALPPTGQLITLEANPTHAEIARKNIARANLSHLIQLLEGPALTTLPTLNPPFDLIFIDADKPPLPDYFSWSLKLSHPGTLIIADNVVRRGAILNPDSPDPAVQGVRRLVDLIARSPHVSATTLQTVGPKGHDGLLLARVLTV